MKRKRPRKSPESPEKKAAKKLLEWTAVAILTLVVVDPSLIKYFIDAGIHAAMAFLIGLAVGVIVSPFGDKGLGPEGESFMEDFELL